MLEQLKVNREHNIWPLRSVLITDWGACDDQSSDPHAITRQFAYLHIYSPVPVRLIITYINPWLPMQYNT
jgi:hypothetical protein